MQHVIQNLPPYTVQSQIASTLVDGAILASFLTVISIIRVYIEATPATEVYARLFDARLFRLCFGRRLCMISLSRLLSRDA